MRATLHKNCLAWFLERTLHKIRTGSDSDQPNTQLVPELERLFRPHFHELTFGWSLSLPVLIL